jgi:hypothetical protein
MILNIVEVPMKRQWHIPRQVHATEDGARRWDQAYQLLLQWSRLNASTLRLVPPPLRRQPPLEHTHENGSLYPRLDAAPELGPDD